jgi:hypothetical protein
MVVFYSLNHFETDIISLNPDSGNIRQNWILPMLITHNGNATISCDEELFFNPGNRAHRNCIDFSSCSKLVANDYYCQLHGYTTRVFLDLQS